MTWARTGDVLFGTEPVLAALPNRPLGTPEFHVACQRGAVSLPACLVVPLLAKVTARRAAARIAPCAGTEGLTDLPTLHRLLNTGAAVGPRTEEVAPPAAEEDRGVPEVA